jgi:hypothetical protein
MGSFFSGLRSGHLLVVAGALVLCAFAWLNNALFYTITPAEVLQVEERCSCGCADRLCRGSRERKAGAPAASGARPVYVTGRRSSL